MGGRGTLRQIPGIAAETPKEKLSSNLDMCFLTSTREYSLTLDGADRHENTTHMPEAH